MTSAALVQGIFQIEILRLSSFEITTWRIIDLISMRPYHWASSKKAFSEDEILMKRVNPHVRSISFFWIETRNFPTYLFHNMIAEVLTIYEFNKPCTQVYKFKKCFISSLALNILFYFPEWSSFTGSIQCDFWRLFNYLRFFISTSKIRIWLWTLRFRARKQTSI